MNFIAHIILKKRKSSADFRFIPKNKRKKSKSPEQERIMYIRAPDIIEAYEIVKKVNQANLVKLKQISNEEYLQGVSGKIEPGLYTIN